MAKWDLSTPRVSKHWCKQEGTHRRICENWEFACDRFQNYDSDVRHRRFTRSHRCWTIEIKNFRDIDHSREFFRPAKKLSILFLKNRIVYLKPLDTFQFTNNSAVSSDFCFDHYTGIIVLGESQRYHHSFVNPHQLFTKKARENHRNNNIPTKACGFSWNQDFVLVLLTWKLEFDSRNDFPG